MQCCRNIINIRRLSRLSRTCTASTSSCSSRRIDRNMYCPISQVSMVTCIFDQSASVNKISHSKELSTAPNENELIDSLTFERVCEETLESLSEYFEELVENSQHLNASDVAYSSGVLTVAFGPPYGTYVINRQSPNRQIWLSSPTSGPKRYDYATEGNYWIYKHDGKSLHQLLQEEIPKIVKTKVDFSKCSHSLVL